MAKGKATHKQNRPAKVTVMTKKATIKVIKTKLFTKNPMNLEAMLSIQTENFSCNDKPSVDIESRFQGANSVLKSILTENRSSKVIAEA